MYYLYKGYCVDYDYKHKNDADGCIVYLHGWLGNKHSFIAAQNYLQKYSSVSISFPPYLDRQSIVPLTMFDFRNIVLGIIKLHNEKNIILICHSFGCRVALMMTTCAKVKKMIITCGAGIKPRKTIFSKLNQKKKMTDECRFHFGQRTGSRDYEILDFVDKSTFKNIVNLDLKEYAKMIVCPCLLYWGKSDHETPKYMCHTFKKLMKNVRTKIVDGGHFAYLENEQDFIYEVKNF